MWGKKVQEVPLATASKMCRYMCGYRRVLLFQHSTVRSKAMMFGETATSCFVCVVWSQRYSWLLLLHCIACSLVTALIRTGVFGHASVVNGLSDLRGGMAYLQAVDTVLVPDFQHLKRRLRRFRLRRMQEEQGQLQRGNQQAVSSDSSSETPGRTHHGRIHKLPGGGGMYTYG
jgi:hypothetical protein